jgi:hypothetical protein
MQQMAALSPNLHAFECHFVHSQHFRCGKTGPNPLFDVDLIAATQLSYCGHSLHRRNLMIGCANSADFATTCQTIAKGHFGYYIRAAIVLPIPALLKAQHIPLRFDACSMLSPVVCGIVDILGN